MREKNKIPMGAVRADSLLGKNVVNMYDGVRICTLREVDFTFDEVSGELDTLLVAQNVSFFRSKDSKYLRIPWQNVQKIGREVIIVELEGEQKSH